MGFDSRRKSLFAKIHWCYQTICFSDIINHAYDLIGDDLKFCAGDSHTVSWDFKQAEAVGEDSRKGSDKGAWTKCEFDAESIRIDIVDGGDYKS